MSGYKWSGRDLSAARMSFVGARPQRRHGDMAKFKEDREDLLRDATAYAVRAELSCAGFPQSIFCGFRDSQAFSVYFGQEAVFQFNVQRELRRAFWQGQLLASYQRELHRLERPAVARMRMSRQSLSPEESLACMNFLTTSLAQLTSCLTSGAYELTGQFPEDADVVAQVADWLRVCPRPIVLAMHPGVGRHRTR